MKDGDRLFRVGYFIHPALAVPAGAAKEKLEQMLSSFKFIP